MWIDVIDNIQLGTPFCFFNGGGTVFKCADWLLTVSVMKILFLLVSVRSVASLLVCIASNVAQIKIEDSLVYL